VNVLQGGTKGEDFPKRKAWIHVNESTQEKRREKEEGLPHGQTWTPWGAGDEPAGISTRSPACMKGESS